MKEKYVAPKADFLEYVVDKKVAADNAFFVGCGVGAGEGDGSKVSGDICSDGVFEL